MITATTRCRIGLSALLAVVAGCSTAPVQQGELIEPVYPAERVLREDVTYLEVADPLEGFNRTMYRFNYQFDRYLFLPAVSAYQTVTPDLAEQGISNFYNNLKDLTTLINSVLQLSPNKAADTTMRILWNSTVGLAGLIDVASALEIPRHQEDFGQTLGYWGVGNGPYLVLPIFGPSNVRDTTGLVVDTVAFNEIDPLNLDNNPDLRWIYTVLNAIDTRANIAFRYYETGSPFEYELVRLLYTTKRKLDIAK